MLCPCCNSPLDRESLEGQTVDRCGRCDGVWFEESELGHVVRRTAAPKVTGRELKPGPAGLACPECKATMTSFNYAHDSGVFVDKCHACSGIWLAAGQLELIAQYRIGTPAGQSLADALAREMRAANRWRPVREMIRSRLLSSIVAVASLLIVWFVAGDAEIVVRLVALLLFPMACIWFCDGMGSLRGISLGLARPVITQTTPGDIVAIGGWLLLLCSVVATLIVLA